MVRTHWFRFRSGNFTFDIDQDISLREKTKFISNPKATGAKQLTSVEVSNCEQGFNHREPTMHQNISKPVIATMFLTAVVAMLAIGRAAAAAATTMSATGTPPGPGTPANPPPGDIRLCEETESGTDAARKAERFEVLPGSGWDNLRNVQMGLVLKINYSLCRTTDDRRFIIPDYMNVYPVKTSRVDSFAEVVENWEDYKSVTSRSINMDAGFNWILDISGTFSDDYIYTKTRQLEDDTMTTRVQERYVRYRAVLQPDMELDPGFKYRLLTIAASLETGDDRQARFDSQQLVREFGTHVTTSVDAGAAIVMEEQISLQLKKQSTYTKTGLKAAARFSFASQVGLFWAGASYDSKSQKTFNHVYMANRSDSVITAIGGSITNRTNFTLEQWTDRVEHDLVAIDRSGEPIYNFITAQTIPEIPASLLVQLAKMVEEAVTTYYKINTHPGCTDRSAQNFSPRANINDGSCRPPDLSNLTFGGMYQTCKNTATKAGDLCSELVQHNPLTGDYSCPKGFEAVSLHADSKAHNEVDHVCGHCWFIFGHCCHDVVRSSAAHFETFWCVMTQGNEKPQESGYMFGGVYTSHMPNAVTSTVSCPHAYMALKAGENMRVCVSNEYLEAAAHAVPFAGFFSCQSGNPLAMRSGQHNENTTSTAKKSMWAHMYTQGPAHWPKRCPTSYSQFMADVSPGDGCEINYCIRPGALADLKLPAIRRPPYMHAPTRIPNPQNAFVFDMSQNIWQKNGEVENKSGQIPVGPGKRLRWSQSVSASDSSYRQQYHHHDGNFGSITIINSGGLGGNNHGGDGGFSINMAGLVILMIALQLVVLLGLVCMAFRNCKSSRGRYQ